MPGGQWIILRKGSTIRNFSGEEGCAILENICNLCLYTLSDTDLKDWVIERSGIVIFLKTIVVLINHFNEENMKCILQDAVWSAGLNRVF